MATNWTTKSRPDPRLPTDPEFVSATALADTYKVSYETLLRIAVEFPRVAQTSEGNPWTESDGPETLFLHEPSISKHFNKVEA